MDQGRLAFTAVYLKSNSGYIGFQSECSEFEIKSVAYCPLKY